ncbi:MAG: hypothetical protein JWQ28_698 [Pedobacter sp.]|jgi:hypothetical protein|nr:hypothetical protein [Pedobacter sp.]
MKLGTLLYDVFQLIHLENFSERGPKRFRMYILGRVIGNYNYTEMGN